MQGLDLNGGGGSAHLLFLNAHGAILGDVLAHKRFGKLGLGLGIRQRCSRLGLRVSDLRWKNAGKQGGHAKGAKDWSGAERLHASILRRAR